MILKLKHHKDKNWSFLQNKDILYSTRN